MARPKKERTMGMTAQVLQGEPDLQESFIEEAPPKKTYEPTTPVRCRSLYPGYMNFGGPKTKTTYRWSNSGDVEYVEYQDLRAAMLARSPHIYNPYIIIDEPDAIEGEEWGRVRELYSSMYSTKDLKEILNYPADKMQKVLAALPEAAQRSVANIAKTMMDTGELDSLKKINIIDEMMGTDLKLMVSGN